MTRWDRGDGNTQVEGFLAAVLTAGSFGLYTSTLCPTVFWSDSAEYAAAAVTLGIAHPPGYPLYTLVAYLFTLLPLEPASAVNLMSAVFGALSVGLCFGVCRLLGASRGGSVIGALTLGAGHAFWVQTTFAEVYTPAVAMLLVVMGVLLRAYRTHNPRLILWGAFLAGLGLGLHLFIATCGLGFVLIVVGFPPNRAEQGTVAYWLGLREWGERLTLALKSLVATLLGASIFLWVPIRAAMNPAINVFGAPSWAQFWWFTGGGPYPEWFSTDPLTGSRLLKLVHLFEDQLTWAGILLALFGLGTLAKQRPLFAVALSLMLAGNTVFFWNYQVNEVEVFFLPSFVVLSIFVAIAATRIRDLFLQVVPSRKRAASVLARSSLSMLPLLLLVWNYERVDLSSYTAAASWADHVSDRLPPGAVIAHFETPIEWKYNAVFGMYYQQVKKQRPDVAVKIGLRARDIKNVLHTGRAVYVYFPHKFIRNAFVVEKEGLLFRLVAPKEN